LYSSGLNFTTFEKLKKNKKKINIKYQEKMDKLKKTKTKN